LQDRLRRQDLATNYLLDPAAEGDPASEADPVLLLVLITIKNISYL
jgi:hypothetical protein